MILSADTVEEPQNQHPDIGCCIIEQYQTRKLEYGFPKRFQILSDSIKSSWIAVSYTHLDVYKRQSGGSPLGVSVRRDCLFCSGHRVDSTGRCWSGKRADGGYGFPGAVSSGSRRPPTHTAGFPALPPETPGKSPH